MFLKVVLFCSQGLGRIYRQVKWKFYYLNKGKFMGLSNEILFILIFLAVPVQQVKMFWSKLAVRRYLSSSVRVEKLKLYNFVHFPMHGLYWKSIFESFLPTFIYQSSMRDAEGIFGAMLEMTVSTYHMLLKQVRSAASYALSIQSFHNPIFQGASFKHALFWNLDALD